MEFPKGYKYTEEHEWIKKNDDGSLTVGITEFAQGELGDIVFIEIETLDEEVEANEIFGTIEAVKTVSDLFMPVKGTIIEVNELLNDQPELINNDPYGDGWLIKITPDAEADFNNLLTEDKYKELTGN